MVLHRVEQAVAGAIDREGVGHQALLVGRHEGGHHGSDGAEPAVELEAGAAGGLDVSVTD